MSQRRHRSSQYVAAPTRADGQTAYRLAAAISGGLVTVWRCVKADVVHGLANHHLSHHGHRFVAGAAAVPRGPVSVADDTATGRLGR